MNRRIMAIAVVLLMTSAASIAVAAYSDGATTVTDLGTAETDGSGSTVTKTFTTNESMFAGYGYTVKFYVADIGSDEIADITASSIGWSGQVYQTSLSKNGTVSDWSDGGKETQKFNDKGFSITLAKDETTESHDAVLGRYTITVEQTAETITPTTIAVKAVLETNAISNGKTDVQTIYYTLDIGSFAEEKQMYIDDITIYPGYTDLLTMAYTDEEKTQQMSDSDYSWFAIGLPAGLSMSSDGSITGICTETTAGSGTVNIVAVAQDGSQYKASVTMTWPAYSSISLKVTDGDGTEIEDSSAIIAHAGDGLTIGAVLENASSGNVAYDITVVNEASGELSKKAALSGSYSLPTAGTGSYKVIVNATDSSNGQNVQYSMSFYVYVLPVFGDLTAHIGLASA